MKTAEIEQLLAAFADAVAAGTADVQRDMILGRDFEATQARVRREAADEIERIAGVLGDNQ